MTGKLTLDDLNAALEWLNIDRPSVYDFMHAVHPYDLTLKVSVPPRKQKSLSADSKRRQRRLRGRARNRKITVIGVDFGWSKDRTVVLQTEFSTQDVFSVLGINEIKTDCKYFSGSESLSCAVNNNCQDCSHYERGDRYGVT